MRERDRTRLLRSLHQACRDWHSRAAQLDALDLAAAMGGPNRAVALGDGLQLMRALTALATWTRPETVLPCSLPLARTTATEMLRSIRGATAAIEACCVRAGLPGESAAPLLTGLLVQVGRQLHGTEGTVCGKERRLVLTQLARCGAQLERQLARALPILPSPIPEVTQGMETGLAASAPDPLPLPEALPSLLGRFQEGITRLRAETVVGHAGRPEVSDAIVFGVEGLVAIWRAYQPLPYELSAKAGGLLCFVEDALAVALDANGFPTTAWPPRSSLRNLLVQVLDEDDRMVRAA
ncbi:hypothetical protein [Roseococcus suduntuyensis]|uniref:Uncharacterized protein n=1 Tax=Roseococcus suduntuyensis TaxID=455361 RepID=A0A840AIW1_9PROT|nr:hypothetical protein [Roseococcus suduntuyensis]MBB3900496.1 hypothetical protein [Roseococcus suduntuyensis]